MKPFLLLNGLKLPEKITRKEFAVMFEEMRKRFPVNRQRPDSGSKPEKKPEPPKTPAKPGATSG
jgi:hypothetical protein